MYRMLVLAVCILPCVSLGDEAVSPLPALREVDIPSTLDDQKQPVLYWAPAQATVEPTPLIVFLHSWSSNYQQDNSKWQKEAVRRNWIYLHPDFRGRNDTPKACGSKFARQDILDAMDWVQQKFQVNPSRVYLAGVSGGGHMSLLMAGHHPERFSAVSAWVGISDMTDWYHFHVKDGEPQKYAKMILKCFGAAPGEDNAIDAEYRDRSPIHHLASAAALPIDIFAGVNDGHAGSVPVRHSLAAFNCIARVHGTTVVSETEMQELWNDRQLASPLPMETAVDQVLGRDIKLRRMSHQSRVTIFDGGHESMPVAAFDWLEKQERRVE